VKRVRLDASGRAEGQLERDIPTYPLKTQLPEPGELGVEHRDDLFFLLER